MKNIYYFTRRIFFLIIYFIPAIILRFLNYRFPTFLVSRIGHLIVEPDSYLKEEALQLTPKRRIVMLASKKIVANHAISDYWREYLVVITSPILTRVCRHFLTNPLTRLDVSKYCMPMNYASEAFRIQALWNNRPPLLRINSNDEKCGKKALEELGICADQWFVCIHSRGGSYSPNDEHVHSFRNCSIDDYMLAVEHITDIGGVCVLMGDSTIDFPPIKKNLIDYAHHPIRSDWLDLYLSANCRFFLGNTSGAFTMASVFGAPVAAANMVPLGLVFPYAQKDIGIPKLYRDIATGRLLSFKEVLDSPMSLFRETKQFNEAGIELLSNSPEDIKDLAIEQFERSANPNFSYDEEDEFLQLRFRGLFKPAHFAYWSASRIGRSFLKKYQNLI